MSSLKSGANSSFSPFPNRDTTILTVSRLYYDDSFSDVTVCFGEKKFRAHKAILSVCSEYFFRLFTGSFKVTIALL
jgi:hypothetical protein